MLSFLKKFIFGQVAPIVNPYMIFENGVSLLESKNYNLAEEKFNQSIKLYEHIGDKSGVSIVNNYLLRLYKETNQLDKQLAACENALPTPAGFRELRSLLRKLSNNNFCDGNIEQATEYLNKLLNLSHIFRICYGDRNIDEHGFIGRDVDIAQKELNNLKMKHGTLYPFTLEKDGLVPCDKFLTDDDREMIVNKVSRHRQIFDIVKNNPGILQKDVHKYSPELSKEQIRNIVYELNSESRISRKKNGNSYNLYIS